MRHIIDPDLGQDIVSLGFVKDIRIDGGQVSFNLELTTPACPIKEQFRSQAADAVGQLPGVEDVQVTLTAMQRRGRQAPEVNTLAEVDTVVAISSCKGGVGKSTVAAHLARAIQREGYSVGLLDVDIYGPSLPTLFRKHSPEVYVQNEMILPIEVDGLKTMSLGYLMGDKPAVMRGPMVSNYTTQMLQQTNWGKLDYLIIDMPPGTGDIQLTLVQQATLDGAIIVTTPQALSLADVSRGILMFEQVQVPVLGVVENMSYFECDGCQKKHHIFGTSSGTLMNRFGLNTLAELPILPGLSDTSSQESGADIQAWAALAENVHREVGKRRANAMEKPTVTAEEGAVHIVWPEGGESNIPNKALRCACHCAICVDEYTGDALLDPATVPDDIAVENMDPLGHYAVAIDWSDGHTSGIYSWERLRGVAEGTAAT